jgi:hypothetical protein
MAEANKGINQPSMSGADLNLIRNELREHDGTGIAAPQRGRIKRIFEKLYDRDGTAFSLKRPNFKAGN